MRRAAPFTLLLGLTAFLSGLVHAANSDPIATLGKEPISELELTWLKTRCGTQPLSECLKDRGGFALRLSRAGAASKKTFERPSETREQRLLADELTLSLAVTPPTEELVRDFVEKNQREFHKPLRIHLFRLLTATREDALAILKKLGETPTPSDFRQACRDSSIDKATKERGGDLGMVWPDGSTDIPQVRTESSLYTAALAHKEGELLREPVEEGKAFAVVWRRDSLPPEDLSEAEIKRIATQRLLALGRQEAKSSLLTDLRKSSLSQHHPEYIDKLPAKFPSP